MIIIHAMKSMWSAMVSSQSVFSDRLKTALADHYAIELSAEIIAIFMARTG